MLFEEPSLSIVCQWFSTLHSPHRYSSLLAHHPSTAVKATSLLTMSSANGEKMKPSFKQQLGLQDDPNAMDHTVSHSGAKVTRMESSQPGFPVYHRRIAK